MPVADAVSLKKDFNNNSRNKGLSSLRRMTETGNSIEKQFYSIFVKLIVLWVM